MHSYKNFAEEQVSVILNRVLKDYPDVCKCQKCLDDMTALVLNSVKPKYVVSEAGKIYTSALNEVNRDEEVFILAQVVQAIETVSKNPRH